MSTFEHSIAGLVQLFRTGTSVPIVVALLECVYSKYQDAVWILTGDRLQRLVFTHTQSRLLLDLLVEKGIFAFHHVSDALIMDWFQTRPPCIQTWLDTTQWLVQWLPIERWNELQTHRQLNMYASLTKWWIQFHEKQTMHAFQTIAMQWMKHRVSLYREIEHGSSVLHTALVRGEVEWLRVLLEQLRSEGVPDLTIRKMFDHEFYPCDASSYDGFFRAVKLLQGWVTPREILTRLGVDVSRIPDTYLHELDCKLAEYDISRDYATPMGHALSPPLRACLEQAGFDTRRITRNTVPFYAFMRQGKREHLRALFVLLRSYGYAFDKMDGYGNNAWSYAEIYQCTHLLPELAELVPRTPYEGPLFLMIGTDKTRM